MQFGKSRVHLFSDETGNYHYLHCLVPTCDNVDDDVDDRSIAEQVEGQLVVDKEQRVETDFKGLHRGLFKVSERKVTWENGRVWHLVPTTGELVYIPLLITDTDTGKARFDSKVMVEIVKRYDGGSVDVRSPYRPQGVAFEGILQDIPKCHIQRLVKARRNLNELDGQYKTEQDVKEYWFECEPLCLYDDGSIDVERPFISLQSEEVDVKLPKIIRIHKYNYKQVEAE